MIEIRPLEARDRAQWNALWSEYLRFYRQHLPTEVTDGTFARLIDARAPLQGLVAERGDTLAGFVHYQFHPTSWSLRDSCYLEDLYVDEQARGGGVGRALIPAGYEAAGRAQAGSGYLLG